jgi:uncharacterized protein (DUF362 family)
MNDRRQFLKSAIGGAILLGSQSKSGVAEFARFVRPGDHQDRFTRHIDPTMSRVVVARDPALHSVSGELNEKRIFKLLDRAIAAYTEREKPVEAWRRILPQGGSNSVIGLKINGGGGMGIATHGALVLAVVERLRQAGVRPGNIVVWDRASEDVEACGLTINTDRTHVRCIGSDLSGYEDQPVAEEPITYGAAANARLSKILTRQCDMVIGLPILTDHSTAGVSFAMKNMSGVVQHPEELDAAGCNPGLADLNLVPAIRRKVCFTIGDAIAPYHGSGSPLNSADLWRSDALIIAEDRVAADFTAWQMIERKRAQAGLPTLAAERRAPLYIATAADSAHNLGFNTSAQIDLVEI